MSQKNPKITNKILNSKIYTWIYSPKNIHNAEFMGNTFRSCITKYKL